MAHELSQKKTPRLGPGFGKKTGLAFFLPGLPHEGSMPWTKIVYIIANFHSKTKFYSGFTRVHPLFLPYCQF
jgi:hypothetical protein